jgi:hypothetical protein
LRLILNVRFSRKKTRALRKLQKFIDDVETTAAQWEGEAKLLADHNRELDEGVDRLENIISLLKMTHDSQVYLVRNVQK